MAEKKSTEKSYKSRKPAATPAKKTTTQTTKKTVTKTPVDKEKEVKQVVEPKAEFVSRSDGMQSSRLHVDDAYVPPFLKKYRENR